MPKHIGIEQALCDLLGIKFEGLTSLTLRMAVGKPITIQTTGYANFDHWKLGIHSKLAQELNHYKLVPKDD